MSRRGLRKPDRGSVSILDLDPFRDVYALQNRIGVQLQQAQLQKRIKVWEAVDWGCTIRKRSMPPLCSSNWGSLTNAMPGS